MCLFKVLHVAFERGWIIIIGTVIHQFQTRDHESDSLFIVLDFGGKSAQQLCNTKQEKGTQDSDLLWLADEGVKGKYVYPFQKRQNKSPERDPELSCDSHCYGAINMNWSTYLFCAISHASMHKHRCKLIEKNKTKTLFR